MPVKRVKQVPLSKSHNPYVTLLQTLYYITCSFLKDANYSPECRVVKGDKHSLTGGREECKGMAGEHFQ